MIDQEINLAIAEACGWRRRDNTDMQRLVTADWAKWKRPRDGAWVSTIPDFCHDLNAMHEAEKMLKEGELRDYVHHVLTEVVAPEKAVAYQRRLETIATARQRAEAFLRVKGLWKE